ncbi:MAG: hypothetical protein OCD76_19915 [Reichenbachiella sp.]
MKRIFEADDAIFDFDEDSATLSFTWKGIVSESTAKTVLTRAIKAAYLLENIHWLIDRRQLEAYAPEARIWIKNDFVNGKGKELIQKTDKMAAVLAHDPMAQVSSKVMINLLREQNPKIEYKEFDVVAPASNWLIGLPPKEEKKKKRGFFSRG